MVMVQEAVKPVNLMQKKPKYVMQKREQTSGSRRSPSNEKQCSKCGLVNNKCRPGDCRTKCFKCRNWGHISRNCRSRSLNHVSASDTSEEEENPSVMHFVDGHVRSSLRILVNIGGPIKRHGVVNFVTL